MDYGFVWSGNKGIGWLTWDSGSMYEQRAREHSKVLALWRSNSEGSMILCINNMDCRFFHINFSWHQPSAFKRCSTALLGISRPSFCLPKLCCQQVSLGSFSQDCAGNGLLVTPLMCLQVADLCIFDRMLGTGLLWKNKLQCTLKSPTGFW